jgi:hypothetical protein
VTDTRFPSPVAAFRGSVTCRRTSSALILAGPAADSPDERLILTLVTATAPDLPESLASADVIAVDERHVRIASGPRDWIIETASVHLHRDIGQAFYRALPPRAAPLKKRLFWRVVLALAHTAAGKRLLLSLRGR